MRSLNAAVLVGGHVHPTGTAWSEELSSVPDRFWDGETTATQDAGADTSVEPPRSGRGSGADAWRAYAESLGIEVPADASRDDIVALVDES